MSYFRKLYRVLPVAALLVATSCERRPMEESINYMAKIPISIDWSESNVDRSRMNGVSVYFFPHDGSDPILTLSNNVDTFYVNIPQGTYSVLLFNEHVEHGWHGIEFTGTDKYDTFLAKAKANTTGRGNPLYNKASGENLIVEPEPLAAWAMNTVVITKEMVTFTRTAPSTRATLSAASAASVKGVLANFVRLKPQPRTARVAIAARIANLNSTDAEYGITGSISGFASGVYMASGTTLPPVATQIFTFSSLRYVWDNPADHKDGTAHHALHTFGKFPTVPSAYALKLNVLLYWGYEVPPFTFNITQQVQNSANLNVELNVGLENRGDEDQTIVLPPSSSNGVSVEDWNQNDVDIK